MVDNKIIDLQEKTLTKDEIERDYVDIKQASQILNNVSTRTAYRYIETVSETKGVNVRVIDIVSNGGKKKLYLKEDIITVSKILNKDKTVLVHVPYNVNDNAVNDTQHSESVPHDMSNSAKTVKELSTVSQDTQNQLVRKTDFFGKWLCFLVCRCCIIFYFCGAILRDGQPKRSKNTNSIG